MLLCKYKVMNDVIKTIAKYFLEALGLKIKVRPWKEKSSLPIFLTDSYDFYETSIFKKPYLFMVVKESSELTPATIRKHWDLVVKKWRGLCVVVEPTITSYNRKRLIEHKVPFVIPGTQLYLPDLGIDLKEHFRQVRQPVSSFSPAAQAVVIYALLNKIKYPISATDLVAKLGYTHMTLSRVFDEIESAKIGTIERHGRERLWNFNETTNELWEQTKSLLKSPVKLRVWVKNCKFNIKAGLSALGYYTIFNPPSLPVYAISIEKWKQIKPTIMQTPEEAVCELEVWYYDPLLFAKNHVVDRYSLYLSLEDIQDERIEKAMDTLWS
jgi:hypothetical protein